MKLEKINPFIKARYEHGYRTARKFATDIGIGANVYWSWENGKVTCPRGDSSYVFHKMCKAFEWTDAEGKENISNMYQWSKNPDIEIVKPNWDDYKHIKPHLGKEVPACTLDAIDMDNPLIKWRAEKDLTRYEAAEIIGIDSTNYALIEDGVYKPASDILSKITEATGLSLTQIAKIYCPLPDEAREEYAKANANADLRENNPADMGCVQDICDDTEPEIEVESIEKHPDGSTTIIVKDAVEDVQTPEEEPDHGRYPFVHAKLSYKETQEILDIIYGKVTLDEYRSIEIILNR